MKVLKFGGSSVANTESIEKVINIIIKESKVNKIFVVVSAFGKTTNKLIEATKKAHQKENTYKSIIADIEALHIKVIDDLIVTEKENVTTEVQKLCKQLKTLCEGCYLLEEITPKTLATISGLGERLSSYIISKILKQSIDAHHKDSQELITTDDEYVNANVNFNITDKKCVSYLKNNDHKVTVLGGFIAKSENGKSTTLGRGGSDYSAAIYASALDASELQIWTDVSGMFSANPTIVKKAYTIPEMSYQEAMEMSYFGAKVIYPPTILPVMKKEIPIRIKNTFASEEIGTLISKKTNKNTPVKGISYIEDIALLTLSGTGIVGVPSIPKRLFEALYEANINVILITQASSEHAICVAIYDADIKKAEKSINNKFDLEISQEKLNPIGIEIGLSIIALVGDNMRHQKGLSGALFSALGKGRVNIIAIAQGASEKNISAIVNTSEAKKALTVLHQEFFEEDLKEINLFIAGLGNVGKSFLKQIEQQKIFLKETLKLNLNVIGLANSKKMFFDQEGISLLNGIEKVNQGETNNIDSFFDKVRTLNLHNSIFIDNTANEAVSKKYIDYLKNGIAVVTCNKIACASNLKSYLSLKEASKKNNASFLYETNVGAGLPIIDTLKNLVASGDVITKIEAVLSGSLNFIFNNFDNSNTFSETVLQAQEKGYTEPDPKIDLSGIDVARKILILARESGYKLNIEDIENSSFLPKECLETTNNEDFHKKLNEFESHFKKIYTEALNKNCKLKYVASFENGKASVGLQAIPKNHSFYQLDGSDNIVLFYTSRYPEHPLQIRGSGAGAEVTASGIFADVIRASNNF